jgi:hypothetical protein
MRIQFSAPHGHLGLSISEFQTGGHRLRCDWQAGEIEGMIGFWEFTKEFLEFKGPKVFYCCEPSFYFNGFRAPKRLLRARLGSLRQDEFAWHYHPDPAMRVVHHTQGIAPSLDSTRAPRRAQALAVLGNLGRPYLRNPGRQARLAFIVNSGCHIYGPESQWQRFRLHTFGRKGPPATYQGECPREMKADRLAGYHACICLENCAESLYFTEKFPDAVRSGCVPVYHAHASVKSAFLDGAVWVDPADYDWDPHATMAAALSFDRKKVAETNEQWLRSHPKLQATTIAPVYSRLAEILARKAAGEINLPEQARRERLKDEYGAAARGGRLCLNLAPLRPSARRQTSCADE